MRRPLAPAPSTPPSPHGETEVKPPLTSAAVVPGAPKPPEAPVLKPFADVVRGARESRGFFGVWQQDDGRIWLEVGPDQLEKPFFFSISLASGLGERYFLPGLMGQEHVVVLRRFGNQLQLVAKNMRVRAPAGTPLARAVSESYSDSLLAAAPVMSAPHPERKTFLVDAAVLLGGDIAGAQTALDSAYRMGYALDRANGSIERTRTGDFGTFITYRSHFAVARMPAPPAQALTGPNPPSTIPDPRSLFLTFTYNLVPLPAEPMRPRPADQRLGHFTTAFRDFGAMNADDRRTHYVERWRLEKKDPAAAVSEPKEPILVWLDRNIPEKYRDAVRAGVLEWNKAFERAGFKDAIVVRQQPDDADWTTVEGTRHLAVRWFAMEGPGAMAVGPSQSDPRTGELLRGAAIIPENWVRVSRAALAETLPGPSAAAAAPAASRPASLAAMLDGRECSYAQEALEQVAFGLELLAARGQLDADGAAAERFIAESLKDVVMHEVGHALGLRHNFKASAGVNLDKLRDAAWVRENGVSNSVMDYVALNIPLADEPATVYTQSTLGAYDYWAIEYAYREVSPEREK
ncbi:MAG TPA: zinc-dependent metalloprotease, partial [Burkholderiaceae bacterium]|nr:zinc-dependent metalloprotease [Burkholderiaceae bacterium]